MDFIDFFHLEFMSKPVWMWTAFLVLVLTLLAFDLGLLHRRPHEIGVKESLRLSGFYALIGLCFGGWVWSHMGAQAGMQYLTGFIVEQSLSIDNIFVMAMILTYFKIPRHLQHRVLFWGILGVITLRAVMIGLGAVMITHFAWILYIFAFFLVLTGFKLLVQSDGVQALYQRIKPMQLILISTWVLLSVFMAYAGAVGLAREGSGEVVSLLVLSALVLTAVIGVKVIYTTQEDDVDLADNPLLLWMRRHLRLTDQLEGQAFTIKKIDPKTGKLATFFTPLFVALVLIEIADVIFAVDSVPAIFTITTDPFIVYTSNIFAVLGLRALYFALSAMMERFEYLKYALALVLIFIGGKIFMTELMGWEKFPAALSLGITLGLLGSGFAYSLWKTRKG
jgi:tellurite resistance protein TerC